MESDLHRVSRTCRHHLGRMPDRAGRFGWILGGAVGRAESPKCHGVPATRQQFASAFGSYRWPLTSTNRVAGGESVVVSENG